MVWMHTNSGNILQLTFFYSEELATFLPSASAEIIRQKYMQTKDLAVPTKYERAHADSNPNLTKNLKCTTARTVYICKIYIIIKYFFT